MATARKSAKSAASDEPPAARTKVRRTQEERRLATRAKLIQAVIDAIQEKGYAQLRTHHIVEKADVTWGAAQHIFGDKDELFLQAATRLSEEIAQRLTTHIDPRKPVRERLSQIIRQSWALYSSPYNFAMAEIVRGKRFMPEFHERVVETQFRIHSEIERQWAKIFADSGATNEQILRVCDVVTLFLSGLASRRAYIRLRGDVEPLLELMADSMAHALGVPDTAAEGAADVGGTKGRKPRRAPA